MQTITTVGLDIAKSVFQVHGVDAGGQVVMHHVLMNQTRDYLTRGRSLANSSDLELQEIWVAAFDRWIEEMAPQNARNIEDAGAELGLRNLELPYARVTDKIKRFQAEKRFNPDTPSDAFDRSIDEFFAARKKPKN